MDIPPTCNSLTATVSISWIYFLFSLLFHKPLTSLWYIYIYIFFFSLFFWLGSPTVADQPKSVRRVQQCSTHTPCVCVWTLWFPVVWLFKREHTREKRENTPPDWADAVWFHPLMFSRPTRHQPDRTSFPPSFLLTQLIPSAAEKRLSNRRCAGNVIITIEVLTVRTVLASLNLGGLGADNGRRRDLFLCWDCRSVSLHHPPNESLSLSK